MDGFGLLLLGSGVVLYLVTRRRYSFFMFLAGVGAGIFIGAIWAYFAVTGLLP